MEKTAQMSMSAMSPARSRRDHAIARTARWSSNSPVEATAKNEPRAMPTGWPG